MHDTKLARTVARYFEMYRMYIQEHNLADDSNSITVADLIEFVKNEITLEDQERYLKSTKF